VLTDFGQNLPEVSCLAGDFSQVILNLIVNAAPTIADAREGGTDRDGTINVSTHNLNGVAEINISDTGNGIPEEIEDRVFDLFFTTKVIGMGTGQGLSISHAVIVKKHGGTITLVSEVGHGTTFTIRLPFTDPNDVSIDGCPEMFCHRSFSKS
jgi:signal transduction histidine kinase